MRLLPGMMAGALMDPAANLRKDLVCVAPDQSDGAHDDDQNYSQHHRVFGKVLTFLV